MTTVWLVETGEYDMSYVVGIYSSPEKAVELIQADVARSFPHGEVTWRLERDEGRKCDILVGDFSKVRDLVHSVTESWDITPMEIDRSRDSDL